MRQLLNKAPSVYENFISGGFVVKRTPGKFKAVGVDMCLEQTINRSQKSSAGVTCSTKKKKYVAQWEMIHHEMLAVFNSYQAISGANTPNTELAVRHDFSHSAINSSERMISKMVNYIKDHENPAQVEPDKDSSLYNILTQEILTPDIRSDLLNFESESQRLYITFRKERFLDKTKALSDTIHRNNIKTFKSLNNNKRVSDKKSKDSEKELAEAQKTFDIARVRNYDMKYLLKFDLIPSSYLFDNTGMMTKTSKSDLCHELEEKYLEEQDYRISRGFYKNGDDKLCFIVDVMSWLRRIPLTYLQTFGELCKRFLEVITSICAQADRIDFIFDTYIKGSVKDCERSRRSESLPIDMNDINRETLIPASIKAFWASVTNKEKLQFLLKKYICENTSPKIQFVLSGTGTAGVANAQPCISIIKKKKPVELHELDLSIEEADVRVIPHALHASKNGAKTIVLLANDTDILVLGLYFWEKIKSFGLRELWMRCGIGHTTRHIPLHSLGERMGVHLCKVLLPVHQLTGCDITSKFGTKASGLKANPLEYLKDFGTDPLNINVNVAEEYLVQVIKPGTTLKTMDDLRFYLYHHSKKTIMDLPPTSRATEGHILRAFYGTYLQVNCLEGKTLDPLCYGFCRDQNVVKPQRCQVILPDDFPTPCKCKTCTTKRCICRKIELKCCCYCDCQVSEKGCKNPL